MDISAEAPQKAGIHDVREDFFMNLSFENQVALVLARVLAWG